MKTGLLSTLALAVLLYAAACALLYLFQRSFIYYPTPATGNPLATDLRIDSAGETLQVWQLNPGRDEAILYFGGNAEDVALNSADFSRVFPEFTVYLVNYRGYGASTGSPSEAALFADAEAVYDRLKPEYRRIHLIGRSLGSGVAVQLAGARGVDRLALVTPFDSIAAVAAGAMPLFPVKWMLRDRFDSIGRAGRLDMPTLVLMAENDRVIPPQHSRRLVEALREDRVFTAVIPGVDHNSIGAVSSYWVSLREFFTRESWPAQR